MKDDYIDKFEQDGLKKQIKNMKRKSFFKTSIISLVVTVAVISIAMILNTSINIKEMNKSLEAEESLIKLTVPNGYILEASYDFEILGGKSEYKIARQIGPKSVVLEDNKKQFGYGRLVKSGVYVSEFRYFRNPEEASDGFWETGHRKMVFFHPSIDYQSYKNDLELLDEIPDGKIIEMGISFDKEYSVLDINDILPDMKKSWIGLDMFTDEYIENKKYEAKNYDPGSTYINEYNMLGISMHRVDSNLMIKSNISELLDLLKDSQIKEHNQIYKKYYRKNKEDIPNMIAATVYGTKDELMKLKNNPKIKATSIGVVEDLY